MPGNGGQGSANCTAPAGIPTTPRSGVRKGDALGPDEPFFPRAGHAWMGNVEGSPAFWVDGDHIEHWAWTNICPGEHVPNSMIYSNRHIKIDDDGGFRFHGHAMQEFAGGQGARDQRPLQGQARRQARHRHRRRRAPRLPHRGRGR